MTPLSKYLVCEGREIHYTEWGAADAPVVIAWHGLARTGRDMDELAAHLATGTPEVVNKAEVRLLRAVNAHRVREEVL